MDVIEESVKALARLREDFHGCINAYLNFTTKVINTPAIDRKTKELILLALAVASQCESCIGLHVQNAASSGASRSEILEASMLAVVMGGGPKLMHMSIVYRELDILF